MVVKFGKEHDDKEGHDTSSKKDKAAETRESKERNRSSEKVTSSNGKGQSQSSFQSPSIKTFFKSCAADRAQDSKRECASSSFGSGVT